jgi:hypothetical protein
MHERRKERERRKEVTEIKELNENVKQKGRK